MARRNPGPEQKVQAALEAVRDARTAIREDEEWQRAVRLATEFPEALRREAEAAAADRPHVVARHRQEKHLKIAALAEVMEVDPPRVSQLLTRAKKEAQGG